MQLSDVDQAAIVPPADRTLTDLVVQQLRKQIILGHLPPGERLTEARLSEQLEVGRSTVREALRRLEAESLIDTRSHRGARVATLSRADAVQISEIHSMLGAHAVRQIKLPIDKALCRSLTRVANQMRELHLPEDAARFIELDNAFHHAIVAAANQRRILQAWTGVSALLSILVAMSVRCLDVTPEEIAERHHIIIAALCQPDPDLAATSIVEHYDSNTIRLQRIVFTEHETEGIAHDSCDAE